MKRYKIGTRSLYIEVVPKKIVGDAGRRARTLTIFFKGCPIRASYAEAALLACLFEKLGHVIPYERLCEVIGHDGSRERRARDVHILRQYMTWVRYKLERHKVPCVIAVAKEVGYALCPMARYATSSSGKNKSSRRSDGLAGY
jgi:DNA-binding response OmpR family regulator